MWYMRESLPQVHEKSSEVGTASLLRPPCGASDRRRPGETRSIFPDSVCEIVDVFVDKKGDEKRCSKIRKDRRRQEAAGFVCAVSEFLPQAGSDAVGRRPWSVRGCAVSNEGSCFIAAIYELSTSEVGGQADWRAFRRSLAGGGRLISLVEIET